MTVQALARDHLLRLGELRMRARPSERLGDYPSPLDLEEALADPELCAHSNVWLDDAGRALAYAWIAPWGVLTFECNPAAGPALDQEVLAWACTEVSRAPAEPLQAACRQEDTARLALLERFGFERTPDRTLHYACPLDTPIPGPWLPPGFRVLRSDQAASPEEWVALHRQAWGTETMTVEGRLAIIAGSDYDPDLDLAALAPDGRLAGYCVAYIAHTANALTGRLDGYTDPLAVHPGFQRRGLGLALLHAALRLLQARGVHTARLSTHSENRSMQSAAFRAGFRVEYETIWLELDQKD